MFSAIRWTAMAALGVHAASTGCRTPAQSPADEAELRVLLVDVRGDAPAAGAEVHARFVTGVEATESAIQSRQVLGSAEFEARVLAEGDRAIADHEGMVVLCPPIGWTEVALVAHSRGKFGAGRLKSTRSEQSAGPRRVELYADFELTVRTVDASGAPVAGVPVCMRRRRGALDDALIAVESGADGVALIPHAGYLRNRAIEGGTATEVSVALDLCLDQAVSVDVAGPQAQPIVLELPPTGTVDVTFAGLEDSLVARDGRVRLARADGRGKRFLDWETLTERPTGCMSADVVAGRARFRFVGLGLELESSGRLNEPSALRRTAYAGPRFAGESVVVSLALGTECANVQGRLVDAQGNVLGEALVRVTTPTIVVSIADFHPFGHSPQSWDVRRALRHRFLHTDAAGRFALDLERVDVQGESRSWLEVSTQRGDRAEFGTMIELDLSIAAETRELGDVVLRGEELVARGRVLDSSRNPVVGAEIELDWWSDSFLEDGEEHLDAVEVATDELGRFELRAFPGILSSLLSVSANDFKSRRLDVIAPEHGDMEIVLSRWGRVEGRAELPPGVDPAQLEVHVVGSSEAPEPWTGWVHTPAAIRLDAEGTFRSGPVQPGPAELRVLYAGRELATRSLVIVEGVPTPVVLELAVFAPLTTLELRDDHGQRVERGAYLVRQACTGSTDDLWRAPRLQHIDTGLIALGWLEPPFDVLVAAPGYRLARFEVAAGMRELVLEPAFELMLELETPPRAFDTSERLTLVLRAPRALAPRGEEMTALSIPSTLFDAEGRAVLAVPGDGLYRMRLELDVHERGHGFERTTWDLGERELSGAIAREPFRIATPRELSR